VVQLNAAGAWVDSINDNIKNPNGQWVATKNGNTNNVFLEMDRNGNSGTQLTQTAESTVTSVYVPLLLASSNTILFKPSYAGVITRLHVVVNVAGTCSSCGNTGITWSVKQGGSTFSCASSGTISCTPVAGTELDCVPTTTALAAGTIMTASETAEAGGACTTQPVVGYALGYRN
jgi:hypothetical protein